MYSVNHFMPLFANNAPNDIPDWFVHVPLSKEKFAKHPSPEEIEDPDNKDVAIKWEKEYLLYDLPEELKWYQERYITANNDYYRYLKEDSISRYFQWRIFYAKRLIEELNK